MYTELKLVVWYLFQNLEIYFERMKWGINILCGNPKLVIQVSTHLYSFHMYTICYAVWNIFSIPFHVFLYIERMQNTLHRSTTINFIYWNNSVVYSVHPIHHHLLDPPYAHVHQDNLPSKSAPSSYYCIQLTVTVFWWNFSLPAARTCFL